MVCPSTNYIQLCAVLWVGWVGVGVCGCDGAAHVLEIVLSIPHILAVLYISAPCSWSLASVRLFMPDPKVLYRRESATRRPPQFNINFENLRPMRIPWILTLQYT